MHVGNDDKLNEVLGMRVDGHWYNMARPKFLAMGDYMGPNWLTVSLCPSCR